MILDGATGLRKSDISGPSWGSDERTRAPIIHLINFAVTDASRLVNYSGYHSGAGIFLVTYFCVHWSGHQGSGSNLAQLRLGSAESGDSRGLQTSRPGVSVIRSGACHSGAAWIVGIILLDILSSDSQNEMKCWYLCNLQSQVHNCFMLDLVPLLDCPGPGRPGLDDVKLSLNNATAAWLLVSWQTH